VYTHDAFPVSCRIEIRSTLSKQLCHFSLTFLTSCLDCASILLSKMLYGVCLEMLVLEICSRGMWWRSWLRHRVTGQKVAGSIPDGVVGIFH